MKASLLIFQASILILGAVSGQELFLPGQPIKARRISSRATQTIGKFCNSADSANKKYCNGAAGDTICQAEGFYQCNAEGTNGKQFFCEGDFGVYCNEPSPGAAKCQSTPATGCPSKTPAFACTSEGVFPDPSDCKKYYNCYFDSTANAFKAQAFQCPNRYVFDPSAPYDYYCRLTNNNYCTTVSCSGAYKNILMSFTWFPKSMGQYVVTCQGTHTPLVYRCDAGFEADLMSLPVECIYTCRGNEKAVYAADDTKYYQCYYNGLRYVPEVTDCFIPLYFNPKTKKCETRPTQATTEPPATTAGGTTVAGVTTVDAGATTVDAGATTGAGATTVDAGGVPGVSG